MARTANSPIHTRTGRRSLPARPAPYFRQLQSGLHIGYRSMGPKMAGKWVVRQAAQSAQGTPTYTIAVLALADDLTEPTWTPARLRTTLAGCTAPVQVEQALRDTVLSFDQATQAALVWASDESSGAAKTVDFALVRYFKNLRDVEAKAERNVKEAESRIALHLGSLKGKDLDALTRDQVEAWRAALIEADEEGQPKMSRDSANRVLTILKAALNFAFSQDWVGSDRAWRGCKPFKGVARARQLMLTSAQVAKLVKHAPTPQLANLISATFLTGCRYGEITTVRVGDLKGSVLQVRESKTQGNLQHLSDQAAEFLATLATGAKGKRRPATDYLLVKNEAGDPWLHSDATKLFVKACKAAKLTTEQGLPENPTLYALRHAHIAQSLDAGANLDALAKNLRTSPAMIRRHYDKFIEGGAAAQMFKSTGPTLKLVA